MAHANAERIDSEKVDIFMPLYVADYLADTMDLTTEEHGAYFLLMCALWRKRGELPADPGRLAQTAKVSPKRWPTMWKTLSRFFIERDGKIRQGRLVREIEKAIGRKLHAQESGRRGGLAKAARVAKDSLPGLPEGGQGSATSLATATPVANDLAKPSSSPSPSPSQDPVSPAHARDPGGPAADTGPAPEYSAVKAHELTQAFGRIRADVFPTVLPWTGSPSSPEKAANMAASIPPEAAADVEPTMRRLWEKAKSGHHRRSADIVKSPQFAFGCWCAEFHELREEIHGQAPPAPPNVTPPRRQRDQSTGYAAPPPAGTSYPSGRIPLR